MSNFRKSLRRAILFVSAMWIAWLASLFIPLDIRIFGIEPRDSIGFIGIFLTPFLHSNMWHLTANSVPLFFLLIMAGTVAGNKTPAIVFMIVFWGGLGVWIFGGPGIHVGASGLIFGLLGFLLFAGIFLRNVKAIIISIIVFFSYGALLLQMLIPVPGISWSGHMFGFLAGIYAAKNFKK